MPEPVTTTTTAAGLAKVFGPALLAGGASLVGGLINSASNVRQARMQMRFQERMRDTSHQAEVKDLIKAGLNPMLSVNKGAATPPGAAANIDIGADRAVHSAMAAMQIKGQMALQAAQANQMNSAAELNRAQAKTVTDTLPYSIDKIKTEIGGILASTGVSTAQQNEIAQRIAQSIEQVKLIQQQTKTEEARALKEKALKTLWQGLEDLLEGADKKVRKNIIPRLIEFWKRGVETQNRINIDPHSAGSMGGG